MAGGGPGASPTPSGPTGSGLRQSAATGGPLCPASFPVTPTLLQGADPSPSVSHTPQNDREGQWGLFSCFRITRQNSTFPEVNSSFPRSYVFSDGKRKIPARPLGRPKAEGGLRQGRLRGSGLAVPSGAAPRCPRRCPHRCPLPQTRLRPGHELQPVPAPCAAHDLFRKVPRA